MTRASVRFTVRLTPRAGADTVDGVIEGALRAHVTAPAVDGAANEALMRLLSSELDVPRSDVHLVAGAAGRRKLVIVDGVDRDGVLARWPDLAV